jgi:hypothetical protein
LAPLKPGSNLAFAYFQYGYSDQYNLANGAVLKTDTHLQSAVGIARYVHYTSIFGFVVAPQILVPFGTLYDGALGGVKMKSTAGLGDIIFAAPVWLVNRPVGAHATYIALTPWVYAPTGGYDANAALNMGGNRWKSALQGSVIQGVTDRITLDLVGDATWYGKNTNSGGLRQTLTQAPTYQVQAMARYKLNTANTVWAGYSDIMGGKQSLAGVQTGAQTDSQQVRVAWQTFVTPTWQLETMLARDVHTEGGFRQAATAQLRLMKIF